MSLVNRILRHRRWPFGLAFVALLWAALAPTLAQAWMGELRAGERVQICTSTGMAWVTLDAAGDAVPDDGAVAATMACDWCLLHGGAAWPPPEARAILPLGADPSVPAFSASVNAVPPPVWWRPQPHAPPLPFV